LSPTPLALLKALKKTQEAEGTKSPFVLPISSAAGHLTTDVLADALMRLTKQPNGRIQLAGGQVRPHDARRTFVAAATQVGLQELISERVLHHSRGAVADT
jgi:hypothetical protein